MDWDDWRNAIEDGPLKEPEMWFAITIAFLFVALGVAGLIALIIAIL